MESIYCTPILFWILHAFSDGVHPHLKTCLYIKYSIPPLSIWYCTLYPSTSRSHCGSCQLTFKDVGPNAENTKRVGVSGIPGEIRDSNWKIGTFVSMGMQTDITSYLAKIPPSPCMATSKLLRASRTSSEWVRPLAVPIVSGGSPNLLCPNVPIPMSDRYCR